MNFIACNSVLTPAFLPSFPLFTQKPKTLFPISCNFAVKNSVNRHDHGEDEEASKFKRDSLKLLQSTVTLTVISASLPKPSFAAAKVSEKRRSSKKTEALTPEELAKWGQGLPVVSDRLMYSEILDLRREEKLKHVIKPSDAGLRHQSEVVLAVLEDNKVFRIVLPSVEDDPKFWKEWDELQMNGLCINAYTPPLKKPETTFSQPYLSFLSNIPDMMYSFVFNFPFKPKAKPKQPQSKKALELKRAREALRIAKEEELAKLRKEREEIAKAAKKQKRKVARKRRKEIQKMKYQQSLIQAADDRVEEMSMMWAQLAKDQTFTTFLGVVFFWIFYQTVIVSYKKQKKDYDDRLKIEAAETEERMRIRALEREMEGIDSADELEDYGDGEDDRYMKIAQQFMRSGARVKRARDRKLPQYLDPTADVKFTDVAGLGKIRLELEEIVKFFTHGDVYRRRGVKIPGGILLCGPPGVGKTLLAKAVAGEAGVNFFSISASQFVEMYVGVGASRVRALYQEARENAPSVVFIDELDAVGRKRGLVQNSGGQERDATLNQLLVSLDGFEGRGEVITIASTNRPDILDPALVRPGRFDRKIYIPKPGRIGRREILEVHARNKPMAPDVDFDAVAAETAGMAGAELANVIEIAALYMIRDERKEIRTEDLIQAVEIEERGLRVRKERSPEKWRQMALYEASMAVVAMTLPDFEGIDFVTIAPRTGRALGYVQARYKDLIKFQKAMFNRLSVFDHICVQLAPRAADELWNGEDQLSTIWAKAANKARLDARNLVLGCVWDKYYGLNNFWISERNNELDVEAIRILDLCYERTKTILEQNRALMNAVVDKLLEQKSLTKKELDNLVALHGLSPQPTPPTLFDIRSDKLLELQNILDKELALQGST